MADFSEQISGFQRQWMEQQQKWMNDWLKTLQSTGGGTPSETWRQALDAMEQQVKTALDVQRHSLMTLAENTERSEGMPEPMTQSLHRMEEAILQWNDMQQELWHAWFDLLRSSAPTEEQPGERVVKNWQNFADRAMEIQKQWFSAWKGGQPTAGKSAGEKAAEESPSSTQPKTEE